jgi:hypothetical protein
MMLSRNDNAMATLLGLFSIGLGLTQILRPGSFTRGFGTRNRTGLVRGAYGARELAAGVGLLTSRDPAPFFASRAAGDFLDIATLGRILLSRNGRKAKAAAALLAVLGITLLDLAAARAAARSR